jgi:molybdopterin molybdotransferase
VQNIPTAQALGCVAAKDVPARLTQPPFSASAMDGYAVRFEDMAMGAALAVIGEAPAGAPFTGEVSVGQAVRIFTGSVVPEGADHVIIQEDVTREGDQITVTAPQAAARNIRRAGVDFKDGEVLIKAGTKLGPADIALAAAGNHAALSVYAPMTVALLANGDELVPPGGDLKAGQIVSSNQAALGSLLQSWGMEVMDLGIAADDPADITARLKKAAAADVIIPIGGASVGDHDHMKAVFSAQGYETLFSKVAVRPGKPVWLAKREAQIVLGLPGNPASAFVCAHIFARPVLGLVDAHPMTALPSSEAIKANGPRDHFQRAKISLGDNNQLHVTPFQATDSSLITPLAQSNALIHLPANAGPWAAGDLVQVLPLGCGPDIFESDI